MALFNNIKRALGFESAIDDEDVFDGIDATVHPLSQHKEIIEQQAVSEGTIALDDNVTYDADAPVDPSTIHHMIFDGVIKIFNDSLPAFIKDSVDPEAQRRYLYNALDDSIKNYLKRTDDEARRRNRSSWERERQRLEADNKSLSDKIKSLEEKSEDGRKQQLSAERQKRALAERVHDLESRIATLEAEKEQYELENKSLLNKLRLTALQADDVDGSVLQAEDVELKQRFDEISQKYAEAADDIEQLKAKAAIADEMISDLNAKTSEAMQQRLLAEKTLAEMTAARDEAATQAAQLQEKLAISSKELSTTLEEVEEAREAMMAIDEIQEQLSRFEEIKEAKDKRISELGTENNRLTMIVESLKAETLSLKKTIESNLYSQAESENALRREIEELRQAASRPGVPLLEDLPPEPIKSTARKKRKPRISAIDESIDDTDWLVAAPPKSGKSMVSEPAPAFGYQPPVKKQQPENDAQMSLW